MNLETEFRIRRQLMQLEQIGWNLPIRDRGAQDCEALDNNLFGLEGIDLEVTSYELMDCGELGYPPDSETSLASEDQASTLSPAIPHWVPSLDLPPSTWVKLVHPSDLFNGEEALILCQIAPYQWLAWIPEYGEVVLGREEFYLDREDLD